MTPSPTCLPDQTHHPQARPAPPESSRARGEDVRVGLTSEAADMDRTTGRTAVEMLVSSLECLSQAGIGAHTPGEDPEARELTALAQGCPAPRSRPEPRPGLWPPSSAVPARLSTQSFAERVAPGRRCNAQQRGSPEPLLGPLCLQPASSGGWGGTCADPALILTVVCGASHSRSLGFLLCEMGALTQQGNVKVVTYYCGIITTTPIILFLSQRFISPQLPEDIWGAPPRL